MINFDSPCMSICSLDKSTDGTYYCVGCKRTDAEIFSWMTFSEDERKQIMEELKERKYDGRI